MLKIASICAALILAVTAFSTSAEAQRGHGGVRAGGFSGARMGGAHFGGARVGSFGGARMGGAHFGGARVGSFGGARMGGAHFGGSRVGSFDGARMGTFRGVGMRGIAGPGRMALMAVAESIAAADTHMATDAAMAIGTRIAGMVAIGPGA